jgi:hypothetical protein
MQVAHCRQDLQAIGDYLLNRQWLHAARTIVVCKRYLPQRWARNIFYDEVTALITSPWIGMQHNAVDLSDVRVIQLGKKPYFVTSGGSRHVRGVDQPFEDDPAIIQVTVPCQVDPAQPASGEHSEHLVPARNDVT